MEVSQLPNHVGDGSGQLVFSQVSMEEGENLVGNVFLLRNGDVQVLQSSQLPYHLRDRPRQLVFVQPPKGSEVSMPVSPYSLYR